MAGYWSVVVHQPMTLTDASHSRRCVQGRRDEAVVALERLRGYGLAAAEAELNETVPASTGGGKDEGGYGLLCRRRAVCRPAPIPAPRPPVPCRMSLWALLRHPVFAWPTAIACILQVAQQLSGINAVFFYSTNFFKTAGVSSAAYATIAAGAVNVLGTGLGMWAIDRAGRKPLLLIGALGMCVACVVITGLQASGGEAMNKAEGLAVVALILLYVVFFELGMGSIPWIIGGEMLPEAPRAAAMGVAAAVNWIFTTVISVAFPPISKGLGNYAFLPFAGVLVLTFLFTLKWVPETRGRTPAQVLAWIRTGSYDAGEGGAGEGDLEQLLPGAGGPVALQ